MADELTQEAEEKYFNHKMMDFQGFYLRHYYCLGYLESAEPREKRIVELEKENAELKSKNCQKTCEYAEPKSQWISQHIQDEDFETVKDRREDNVIAWKEIILPELEIENDQRLNR